MSFVNVVLDTESKTVIQVMIWIISNLEEVPCWAVFHMLEAAGGKFRRSSLWKLALPEPPISRFLNKVLYINLNRIILKCFLSGVAKPGIDLGVTLNTF